MSGDERLRPTLASVLDRLVDRDPDSARDSPVTDAERLRQHRLSVLRDLSNLLNSRRAVQSLRAEHEDLSPSALDYGIDDPSSADLASARERERFRQDVEASIRLYEPRFRRVSVRVLESASTASAPTLRLRIEALLHAEPAPLSVTFDSVLDPADGSFDVEDRGS